MNVSKFKYLGTALTNKNDVHDEIRERINSGIASYYVVWKLIIPSASKKKTEDQGRQNSFFTTCFVWMLKWFLTLMKGHELLLFDNREVEQEVCTW